jgi:membrane-associated HD superfamily phosphohydrolase
MDLKNQILVALGLDKAEEVNMAWQSKLEDGTIVVSTAETLEAGVDASVLTEDGTTIPLPIGTYKTEDGLSFRIEAEGVVAEVMESETEEKDTTEEEDLAVEDKKEDDYADVGDWEGMEKRIQNLEDAVADLKRSKEGGDDDVEEMAEEVVEPSVNPKSIKTTEVKEFSIEEELETIKAENEKLKTELAEAPAEAPLNTNKFSADKPALTKKEYNKLSRQQRFLHNLNK